jgi:hypothetical protein
MQVNTWKSSSSNCAHWKPALGYKLVKKNVTFLFFFKGTKSDGLKEAFWGLCNFIAVVEAQDFLEVLEFKSWRR